MKGMSATMGYNKIAELTHEMEDVLDMLRKEQLKVTGDIIDTLFKCIDSLEQMINNVANGDPEDLIDVSDLVAKLSAISKGDAAAAAPAASPAPVAEKSAAPAPVATSTVSADLPVELSDTEKKLIAEAYNRGMRGVYLKVTLAESCLLKSARSYMVMNSLEELSEVIRTIPPAEDLEQEAFDRSFEVILLTASEEDAIRDAVMNISEIESADTKLINLSADSAPQAAPTPAPVVEQKSTATAPATAPAPAPISKPSAPANKPASSSSGGGAGGNAAANAAQKKSHAGQSVRVDIEKLDTLMNLMGELVINKVRLEQIGQTHRLSELTETLEQMDRVTTDLQNIVMKVRMVPVSQVFNRFPRMVRDVTKELNKEMKLNSTAPLSTKSATPLCICLGIR